MFLSWGHQHRAAISSDDGADTVLRDKDPALKKIRFLFSAYEPR